MQCIQCLDYAPLEAFADDCVFYQRHYIYEACKQQGITFQVQTFAPFRTLEAEPSGFIVYNFAFAVVFLERGQFGELAEELQ